MKKISILILLSVSLGLQAQLTGFKNEPNFSNSSIQEPKDKILNKPAYVMPWLRSNRLDHESERFTQLPSTLLNEYSRNYKILELDQMGTPSRISFFGEPGIPFNNSSGYWAKRLRQVFDPSSVRPLDFILIWSELDELGIWHYKYAVHYNSNEISGAEYIVHVYPDQTVLANGHVNLPDKILESGIGVNFAFNEAKKGLSNLGFEVMETADHQLPYAKTGLQSSKTAYWFNPESVQWHLVYEFEIFSDVMHKWIVLVDAQSGKLLKTVSGNCKVHCQHLLKHGEHELNPEGAEVSSGRDLFDINRSMNVWREGSFLYLIDGSRPMFKASSFKLDNPVGAIWTLDGLNSKPNNIRVDQIKTNSNTWSKTAVSAHYNAGLAYEYFLNTHARNSINGKGGTIISIINIIDENGGGMDNAFWNGEAMFYGNGAQSFNPLARGLDVAGHEMSHGVIQSTANLAYENEAGAINESFADVFGAMIDRNDWKLGEDVVKLSAFPSGALRDMSNPHNGAQTGDFGRWQPKHVSEQYFGTADNGGVHINSGIPNHAFYLFVQGISGGNEEQGKKTAEKIYYRALSNYLTRSSNFKDLRSAVEQACIDLHGNNSAIHNAAKNAFSQVGIGSSGNPGGGGTQYQKDLPVNPGNQYVICTDDLKNGVYLINIQTSQIFQLSNRSIVSKPSISDNGAEIYYVGLDSKLYGLFLNQNTRIYEEFILDSDPIYRNAAISKDGRLLSVLYTQEENKIHVFDFVRQNWKTFTLTNPTTGSGINTSNVRYADFMDFQHSGEYLMYDCLSKLDRNTGGSYEYWDIGFLRVWDNLSSNFGDGHIEKLFSDIPENTSVGNPVFAKNSPYIIAFDYLEEDLFGNTFSILGANIETGTVNEIAGNRDDVGFPNYSVDDRFLMYDGFDNSQDLSLVFRQLASNKIQSGGNEQLFVSEARWGSFFADGTRVLINTTEIPGITAFVVYPNPVRNRMTLEFESDNSLKGHLNVLSNLGELILQKSVEVSAGRNQLDLDLNGISAGVYSLQLVTGEGQVNTRLIKLNE